MTIKILYGIVIGVFVIQTSVNAWRLGMFIHEDRELASEVRTRIARYKPEPPLRIDDQWCAFATVPALAYTVSCGDYHAEFQKSGLVRFGP